MEIIPQLNHFKPIDLAQMNRVKLLRRSDTKYLISKTELLDFLVDLATDYFVLEIKGKRIASYHTKYLDTHIKSFYHEHHQGKLKRHKVRFRTYLDSELSFLEVKLKYKAKTNKKRMITEPSDSLDEDQKKFLRRWIPQNPMDLFTSLENSFQRITLVHKTVEERVTIDLNLLFVSGEKKVKFKDQVIIEIKQSHVNRDTLMSRLLRSQGTRKLRVSKYCIGCILVDPSLKYNRFKSRLLKINEINPIWNF
tara:strand:+ start:10001 stop:10753 length:753 start_codon:yes stop_codon:yes gene_type:complete